MKRTQVIVAGTGLAGLNTITQMAGLTYHDSIFWLVLVPLSIVLGIFIGRLAGG